MRDLTDLTDNPRHLSLQIDDPVVHVSRLNVTATNAPSWAFVSLVDGEEADSLRQLLNNENVRAFIISIGVVVTLILWMGALFFG